MTRGSRATLISLGVLLALLIASNIAAALFADRFGVGMLDLDGASSLVGPGPAELPPPGPDRVHAILALYSEAATTTHIALTLSLDILLPVAGTVFGVIATRNLRAVLGAPQAVATVGAILAVAYGLSDLLENALEVLLLSGATATWMASALAGLHVVKNVLIMVLLGYVTLGYAYAGIRRRRRPGM